MAHEVTKSLLAAVAFSCLAVMWATDWRTNSWFGHSFTVGMTILAILAFTVAVVEIASQ